MADFGECFVRCCGPERLAVRWLDTRTGEQWNVAYDADAVSRFLPDDPTQEEILNAIEELADRGGDLEGDEPIAYRLAGGRWTVTPIRWRASA